jgi:hypothetical protein
MHGKTPMSCRSAAPPIPQIVRRVYMRIPVCHLVQPAMFQACRTSDCLYYGLFAVARLLPSPEGSKRSTVKIGPLPSQPRSAVLPPMSRPALGSVVHARLHLKLAVASIAHRSRAVSWASSGSSGVDVPTTWHDVTRLDGTRTAAPGSRSNRQGLYMSCGRSLNPACRGTCFLSTAKFQRAASSVLRLLVT